MAHGDLHLFVQVVIGFAIAYLFGFERQLRGSPAGDRTFTLVGGAATAVTAVAGKTSPQAVAGVMTGIGFIGAGVVFNRGGAVKGITTAASLFAVAAMGIVVGYDHILLGLLLAGLLLLLLELQHIPFLSRLDGARYSGRFQNDRVWTVDLPEYPAATRADSHDTPPPGVDAPPGADPLPGAGSQPGAR